MLCFSRKGLKRTQWNVFVPSVCDPCQQHIARGINQTENPEVDKLLSVREVSLAGERLMEGLGKKRRPAFKMEYFANKVSPAVYCSLMKTEMQGTLKHRFHWGSVQHVGFILQLLQFDLLLPLCLNNVIYHKETSLAIKLNLLAAFILILQ